MGNICATRRRGPRTATSPFANNQALTVTGTSFNAKQQPQVLIKDGEFGFNKLDAIVVDSRGAKIICEVCRVSDTGNSTHLTSDDVLVTANASAVNGPALTVIGGLFTDGHANDGSFFHINNFKFASGASAQIVIDGTTTTAAVSKSLVTNLGSCACTATIVGEQSIVAGTRLLDPVLPNERLTMGGDYTSANSCLSEESAGSVFLEACDASAFTNFSANSVRLRSGTPSSSFYTQVQAASGLTANYTFALPATIGNSGAVLSTSGAGSAQKWVDVSRFVSNFNNSSGVTLTVPARLNINPAFQMFDLERGGNPGAAITDHWDTASAFLSGYGGAGAVSVGAPLYGVICNNTGQRENFDTTGSTGVTFGATPMSTPAPASTCRWSSPTPARRR